MPKEIERKFLLSAIPPEVMAGERKESNTIYPLVLRDDDKNIIGEIRIRRTDGKSKDKITFKGKGDLSRTEIETKIPDKEFYNSIIDSMDMKPINKIQYKFPLNRLGKDYGDLVMHCSFVDEAFVYAEVEFRSEEEARAFVFPWTEYLVEDVTYKPEFKMANYWLRTRANKLSSNLSNNIEEELDYTSYSKKSDRSDFFFRTGFFLELGIILYFIITRIFS